MRPSLWRSRLPPAIPLHVTSGAAAISAPHAHRAAAPRRRRARLAAAAAVCGVSAYAIFGAMAHGSAIDARVRALESENSALQQQIAQRQAEIAHAGSSDWLQEQARRLGFVFPGEGLYILTGPTARTPTNGGVNAPLPTFAPPTPTATPAPASPSPSASATPVTFNLASPSPH
ncbi:MAG: FtsB family cell division protein [Candidatus Dormibacteria bacterium]